MSQFLDYGTHEGRLSSELKQARVIKNARNAARRGQERKPGSSKRVHSRLFMFGNRQQRVGG